MTHKRWGIIGVRQKLILIAILIVFLLADGVFTWQQNFSADTVTSPAVSNLKGQNLSAAACKPDDIICLSGEASNGDGIITPNLINNILLNTYGMGAKACLQSAAGREWMKDLYDNFDTLATDDFAEKDVWLDAYQCVFYRLEDFHNSNLFPNDPKVAAFNVKVIPKISNVDKTRVNGNATNTNVKIDSTQTLPPGTKKYYLVKKPDNIEWDHDPANLYTYTIDPGEITFNYVLTLNGYNNYTYDQLEFPRFDAAKDGLIFNKPDTQWINRTSGSVNGKATLKFIDGKAVITYLDFCPTGCEIKNVETLIVKATKQAVATDPYTGNITANFVHMEIMNGKGVAVQQNGAYTGTIKWANDLKINKYDKREWNKNLKNGSYDNFVFNFFQESTADLRPLDKTAGPDGYSKLVTDLTKHYASKFRSAPDPTRPVMVNKIDIARHEENITDATQGLNNSVTRRGTGVRYSGAEGTTLAKQQGIFTNANPNLYINYTTGGYTKNIYLDLFNSSYVPAAHSKSYFSDLIVPGFFAAGYSSAEGKKTILSTAPVKAIPQKVYFFNSVNPTDPVFQEGQITQAKNFLTELENKYGFELIFVDTKSKNAMIDAFDNVPDNAWVLNIGHGYLEGLVAGTERVAWSEIISTLEKNKVKLDVFAADSCYGGRAAYTPIAETVIGSINIGTLTDAQNTAGLNTLIGVGGNLLTATDQSVLGELQKLLPQPTSCNI